MCSTWNAYKVYHAVICEQQVGPVLLKTLASCACEACSLVYMIAVQVPMQHEEVTVPTWIDTTYKLADMHSSACYALHCRVLTLPVIQHMVDLISSCSNPTSHLFVHNSEAAMVTLWQLLLDTIEVQTKQKCCYNGCEPYRLQTVTCPYSLHSMTITDKCKWNKEQIVLSCTEQTLLSSLPQALLEIS